MRHQIGIGDQHPRRILMGAKYADRLARLNDQGLVGLEPGQGSDNGVETFPIARGATDSAINHQFLGPLGHVRMQIIHQHA